MTLNMFAMITRSRGEAEVDLAGFLGMSVSAADVEDDKRFIQCARKAMIMGFNIVYGAWW
jgi:hypothetical protein